MTRPAKPLEQAAQDAVLSAPAIAPQPPHAVSVSLTYAWRALLKIKHMPEQLFDVVVTPIMFTVMFTYLFGGALAGSTGAYLQFLLPGILVQTIVFTSVYTGFTLNTDISKGGFRPLPLPAGLEPWPDRRGHAGRYLPLHGVWHHCLHYRHGDGLPARRRLHRRHSRPVADECLCARIWLDIHRAGTVSAHAFHRDDAGLAGADAAHFCLQHLCRSGDDAGAGCRRWCRSIRSRFWSARYAISWPARPMCAP